MIMVATQNFRSVDRLLAAPAGAASEQILRLGQDKARALGLDIGQINQTVSAAWGGSYINDFIDRGRVKRVYVQADEPYRR